MTTYRYLVGYFYTDIVTLKTVLKTEVIELKWIVEAEEHVDLVEAWLESERKLVCGVISLSLLKVIKPERKFNKRVDSYRIPEKLLNTR